MTRPEYGSVESLSTSGHLYMDAGVSQKELGTKRGKAGATDANRESQVKRKGQTFRLALFETKVEDFRKC